MTVLGRKAEDREGLQTGASGMLRSQYSTSHVQETDSLHMIPRPSGVIESVPGMRFE